MMQFLAKILVAPLVWVLSLAGYSVTPQTVFIGADNTNAVGGETYVLGGSGLSSSGTSLTLTSFTIPGGDTKIQMTDFGDLGCATIEPGSKSRQEFISFTGVTQNSDGTASITGITRGLSPLPPYTASTTLQQSHAGGSQFVISNSPPCFYENYTQKDNDDTITGQWTFSSAPIDVGTSTSTLQFATRAYANAIAVQGSATSTVDASGIGLLATGAQAAAGTYTLTSPYFLSTLISTSTYFGNGSNKVVVTGSMNTIDSNFIATSSSQAPNGYSWTASTTFSGATTTINNISVAASVTSPSYFRGIPYVFPSTQGASSTVLMNNGSGSLGWYAPQWELLGESIVGTASPTTTVTFTGVHRNLMIMADISGVSANTSAFLVFNNDVGTNYSNQLSEQSNTVITGYTFHAATSTRLRAQHNDTWDEGHYTVFMNNVASRVKVGTFSGQTYLSGSTQNRSEGGFSWSNTSDSITSVSLTTGHLATFSSGTRLLVYGSRD